MKLRLLQKGAVVAICGLDQLMEKPGMLRIVPCCLLYAIYDLNTARRLYGSMLDIGRTVDPKLQTAAAERKCTSAECDQNLDCISTLWNYSQIRR
jgi:hypothetical protein